MDHSQPLDQSLYPIKAQGFSFGSTCPVSDCVRVFRTFFHPWPSNNGRALQGKAPTAAAAREWHVVAEPEARTNSFVGTEEYLAPEVITGAGHGVFHTDAFPYAELYDAEDWVPGLDGGHLMCMLHQQQYGH